MPAVGEALTAPDALAAGSETTKRPGAGGGRSASTVNRLASVGWLRGQRNYLLSRQLLMCIRRSLLQTSRSRRCRYVLFYSVNTSQIAPDKETPDVRI